MTLDQYIFFAGLSMISGALVGILAADSSSLSLASCARMLFVAAFAALAWPVAIVVAALFVAVSAVGGAPSSGVDLDGEQGNKFCANCAPKKGEYR